MCKAKARIAKCGHTVEYEIMAPCAQYPGTGPPCASWNEKLLNKVLLRDHPICIGCHLLKEKKIARQYVDAEWDLVRSPKGADGSPKDIYEVRLRNGVKMQADVYGLDAKVGREGKWREESTRIDWQDV